MKKENKKGVIGMGYWQSFFTQNVLELLVREERSLQQIVLTGIISGYV